MSREVCHFFLEGTCKKGEHCLFRHPSGDREEASPKRSVCKFFDTAGGCKKGNDCPFVHIHSTSIRKERVKKESRVIKQRDEVVRTGAENRHTQQEVHVPSLPTALAFSGVPLFPSPTGEASLSHSTWMSGFSLAAPSATSSSIPYNPFEVNDPKRPLPLPVDDDSGETGSLLLREVADSLNGTLSFLDDTLGDEDVELEEGSPSNDTFSFEVELPPAPVVEPPPPPSAKVPGLLKVSLKDAVVVPPPAAPTTTTKAPKKELWKTPKSTSPAVAPAAPAPKKPKVVPAKAEPKPKSPKKVEKDVPVVSQKNVAAQKAPVASPVVESESSESSTPRASPEKVDQEEELVLVLEEEDDDNSCVLVLDDETPPKASPEPVPESPKTASPEQKKSSPPASTEVQVTPVSKKEAKKEAKKAAKEASAKAAKAATAAKIGKKGAVKKEVLCKVCQVVLEGNKLLQPSQAGDYALEPHTCRTCAGEVLKGLGNDSFKKGDHEKAIRLYGQAIRQVPENLIYRLNRAASYLLRQQYADAFDDCMLVLAKEPENPKALLRAGRAAREMGLLQESRKLLMPIAKEPGVHDDIRQLQELESLLEKTSSLMPRTALDRLCSSPSSNSVAVMFQVMLNRYKIDDFKEARAIALALNSRNSARFFEDKYKKAQLLRVTAMCTFYETSHSITSILRLLKEASALAPKSDESEIISACKDRVVAFEEVMISEDLLKFDFGSLDYRLPISQRLMEIFSEETEEALDNQDHVTAIKYASRIVDKTVAANVFLRIAKEMLERDQNESVVGLVESCGTSSDDLSFARALALFKLGKATESASEFKRLLSKVPKCTLYGEAVRHLDKLMKLDIKTGKPKSFYDLLEVPRTATEAQIRDACLRKIMQHLNDNNGSYLPLNNEMRWLKKAYETLIKEQRRRRYDACLDKGEEYSASDEDEDDDPHNMLFELAKFKDYIPKRLRDGELNPAYFFDILDSYMDDQMLFYDEDDYEDDDDEYEGDDDDDDDDDDYYDEDVHF